MTKSMIYTGGYAILLLQQRASGKRAIEKNVDAIRFYERHGFYVTDHKKFEEGTTEYLVKLALTA